MANDTVQVAKLIHHACKNESTPIQRNNDTNVNTNNDISVIPPNKRFSVSIYV